MKQTTVWFNSHADVFPEMIRREDKKGELRVIFTDKRWLPNNADFFEVFPNDLGRDQFTTYSLSFARQHGVNIFIPCSRYKQLSASREAFRAAGVNMVMAGNEQTIDLVDDKGAAYEHLSDVVPIPQYRVVHDVESFEAACAELSESCERVCYKPVDSIFGLGFRVLGKSGESVPGLFSRQERVFDLSQCKEHLSARQYLQEGLMVMQYLEGTERSVDCLAQQGKLVSAIIRAKEPVSNGAGVKPDNIQLIEHNPQIVEYVRRITEKLTLHGLFNVQFRNAGDGTPYLLEINARLSGGAGIACMSGVTLPYWAVRLELGTATSADVPEPKTGFRVQQLEQGIVVL